MSVENARALAREIGDIVDDFGDCGGAGTLIGELRAASSNLFLFQYQYFSERRINIKELVDLLHRTKWKLKVCADVRTSIADSVPAAWHLVRLWYAIGQLGYNVATRIQMLDFDDWLEGPCEPFWRNQVFPKLVVVSEDALTTIDTPPSAITTFAAARALVKMRDFGSALKNAFCANAFRNNLEGASVAWIHM